MMTIQCKVITRHTNTRNNNTTYLETHCDRGVLPRRPVDPAATRSGSSRTGARRGGAAGAAGPKQPGGRAVGRPKRLGPERPDRSGPKRPDRSGQAGGRSTAGEEARVRAQGAGEVRAQGAGEAAGARPTAGPGIYNFLPSLSLAPLQIPALEW